MLCAITLTLTSETSRKSFGFSIIQIKAAWLCEEMNKKPKNVPMFMFCCKHILNIQSPKGAKYMSVHTPTHTHTLQEQCTQCTPNSCLLLFLGGIKQVVTAALAAVFLCIHHRIPTDQDLYCKSSTMPKCPKCSKEVYFGKKTCL